jgi:SAM-dependent methyltransferase
MASRPATATDIVDCYRVFFNREPESAEVINHHLAAKPTLSEFLERVVSVPEFSWVGQRAFTSFAWNPGLYGRVDVNGSRSDIEALVEHTRKVWADYGDQDPFWSVLTNDKYHASSISQGDIDEFYASGAIDCCVMEETLGRVGLSLPANGTGLDLGCGLGRIGEHVSKRVKEYIGVDISPPHLRQATERFKHLGRKNARFMLLPHLLEADLKVDLAFSLIVLQHNPPPVIALLIDRLCKLLKEEGILYFQVPVALTNYEFNLKEYTASPPAHGHMEMHCIPQREVYRLFEANNCQVIEALPDARIGHIGLSYSFIAQKRKR